MSDKKSLHSEKDLQTLIDDFNSQIGNQAWTSARATHDTSMIDALIERGVDVSAVYEGAAISFTHKIALSEDGKKLVTIS